MKNEKEDNDKVFKVIEKHSVRDTNLNFTSINIKPINDYGIRKGNLSKEGGINLTMAWGWATEQYKRVTEY